MVPEAKGRWSVVKKVGLHPMVIFTTGPYVAWNGFYSGTQKSRDKQ